MCRNSCVLIWWEVEPNLMRETNGSLQVRQVSQVGRESHAFHPQLGAVEVGDGPMDERLALLALYRTRRQPAHEVPLKREEHDQRNQHGDEGARGQHVPRLTALADQRG